MIAILTSLLALPGMAAAGTIGTLAVTLDPAVTVSVDALPPSSSGASTTPGATAPTATIVVATPIETAAPEGQDLATGASDETPVPSLAVHLEPLVGEASRHHSARHHATAAHPVPVRVAAGATPTSDDPVLDDADWLRAMHFGLPGVDSAPVGTSEPRQQRVDSDLLGSPSGASASAAAAVLSGLAILGLATTLATVVAPVTRPRSRRHLLRLERPD